MLNVSLPNPQDVSRRAQLRQLRKPSASAPTSHFRVRAWRWHHLGVVRDLSRVETRLSSRSGQLCPAAGGHATREQLLDAVRYIVHDNWGLHDFVETRLFIPWLRQRFPDRAFARRAELVAAERARLQREAESLTRAVERWVDVAPARCRPEMAHIRERVLKLRENARLLFEASEAVFIPRVVGAFSEKEQLKFNSHVLKNISGRQARISLVIFGDAVQQSEPVVATVRDRQDFESDIPAPIRKLAMPYWRRKFVSHKVRFISENDPNER